MTTATDQTVLVGRSSSHFTRLTRIFAAELGVPYSFRVVRDLLDRAPTTYAGNPALKVPILILDGQTHFGSLGICRRLAEQCPTANVQWPEDLSAPNDRNACEVVTQAMTTEVAQIMAGRGGVDPASAYVTKLDESLLGSLQWLETYLAQRPETEPSPILRFLDVSLFCLISHLKFRDAIDLAQFPHSRRFVDAFSTRESAKATEYRYD